LDKLERLLNLTLTLLETPRPLSAMELRDRVPGYPDADASFRRAFERDKDSLREMGIPVLLELIPHTDPPTEGYRIHADQYYLRDPGFEPDELAALHLAASAVRIDAAHGIEGLWKLGAVASGAVGEDPLQADLSRTALAELPSDPNLGAVFGAVAERCPLRFGYGGAMRTIDPYRLDHRRGRWYVSGFDHDRGEERNFRLDRIEGEAVAGPPASFERPSTAMAGGPAQPWQFGEGETVTATVLIDREQAPWLRQHLGGEGTIETQPDGSVIATIEVTNWPAFRSFLLTFLEHAELLDPPDLRAEMIEWLQMLAGGAS
jgi:proteasome accessory factor B